MRGGRRAADCVDRHIDLITFLDRVQYRKSQAGFGPERGRDEFAATDRFDRLLEFGVLPAVNRGAVIGRQMAEHVLQFPNRRFVAAGFDVDRRMNDWKVVVEGCLGDARYVENELVAGHRADRGDLDRLVVDDDEHRILRRQELVGMGIADDLACHLQVLFSVVMYACGGSRHTRMDGHDLDDAATDVVTGLGFPGDVRQRRRCQEAGLCCSHTRCSSTILRLAVLLSGERRFGYRRATDIRRSC
jgi:hypothetical protein